tara:strand:- start:37 stop:645 length:609 start_codon:yes stop_codon:yes gene_type:complete
VCEHLGATSPAQAALRAQKLAEELQRTKRSARAAMALAAEAPVAVNLTRECVLKLGDAQQLVRVHHEARAAAAEGTGGAAGEALNAAELLQLRANFVAAERPDEVHVLFAGCHALCQAGDAVMARNSPKGQTKTKGKGKKGKIGSGGDGGTDDARESSASASAIVGVLNAAFEGRGGGNAHAARSKLGRSPTLDELVEVLEL